MTVPDQARTGSASADEGLVSYDRLCAVCFQVRRTVEYRGLYICDKDWRKREAHRVAIAGRKRRDSA